MYYTVDLCNRIIEVDSGWDASAVESASGPSAPLRSKVIGRHLEDFMAGDATKMFVRAALDAARLRGEQRVLPYRCDSPAQRRRFEMVISPLGAGLVKVEHNLVAVEARLPRRAPLAAARAMAGWRCSQCLAVRQAGSVDWVDDDGCAQLAQDVCPRCASKLFGPPPALTEKYGE